PSYPLGARLCSGPGPHDTRVHRERPIDERGTPHVHPKFLTRGYIVTIRLWQDVERRSSWRSWGCCTNLPCTDTSCASGSTSCSDGVGSSRMGRCIRRSRRCCVPH